jgi:hypothetical protein
VLLDPISAQPPDRTTGMNSPSTLSKILSVSDFVLFKGPLACEIKAMYGNYLAITKKSIKLEDLYIACYFIMIWCNHGSYLSVYTIPRIY